MTTVLSPFSQKKDISSPQKIHCFLRGSVVDYTLTHGSTENARQETTAQSKMQGWKLRERKQWHSVAGCWKRGIQASVHSQKNT